MKSFLYNRIFSVISIGLFAFLLFQQETVGQEKAALNLNEILSKLTFTSRINNKESEINEKLITAVRERKVNFILTSEDEKSLRKAGGNDLLIKTIRENLPEKLEEQIILYKKFTDNYNGKTVENRRIALEAAKEFVKKYSDDESVKEIVKYFTAYIPKFEKIIRSESEPCTLGKTYENFEKFFKAKKWNELFDVGAEILKTEPTQIDVTITLASVGFDNLINESKRDFLNETLNYAEKSINLLETEKAEKTDLYGIYNYSLRNKEFPDGKANALGYMNYIVGYIKYFYLDQKDEAISYFQKSLKYKSKSNALIRQLNLPLEMKE